MLRLVQQTSSPNTSWHDVCKWCTEVMRRFNRDRNGAHLVERPHVLLPSIRLEVFQHHLANHQTPRVLITSWRCPRLNIHGGSHLQLITPVVTTVCWAAVCYNAKNSCINSKQSHSLCMVLVKGTNQLEVRCIATCYSGAVRCSLNCSARNRLRFLSPRERTRARVLARVLACTRRNRHFSLKRSLHH